MVLSFQLPRSSTNKMIKVIPPGSYDFGEPATSLVKMSKYGLHGNDLTTFIKRAGHQFADAVKNLDIRPGEVPIHLIALGATEGTGPNKNSDGVKEADCVSCHHTFVKHARFFRNHLNKNKAISYGVIKFSSYNEKMKRIELLVALNSTKQAAEHNKGLVADKEMEKLAKEEELGVSMALRLPFDVCTGCGNKSKNREEYCTSPREGGFCKRGGLRYSLGKVCEDGHILHADNPNPTFFDISHVFRPADRIAYVFGKIASATSILGGAELAEEMGLTSPPDLLLDNTSTKTATQIKILQICSDIESGSKEDFNRMIFSFSNLVQPQIDWTKHADCPANSLAALTVEKVALPIDHFLEFVGCTQTKIAETLPLLQSQLPGSFTKLLYSDFLETNISYSDDLENRMKKSVYNPDIDHWAKKAAVDYSLDKFSMNERRVRAALNGQEVKQPRQIIKIATDNSIDSVLAQYTLYKVAFLSYWYDRLADSDFHDLAKAVVVQNYS